MLSFCLVQTSKRITHLRAVCVLVMILVPALSQAQLPEGASPSPKDITKIERQRGFKLLWKNCAYCHNSSSHSQASSMMTDPDEFATDLLSDANEHYNQARRMFSRVSRNEMPIPTHATLSPRHKKIILKFLKKYFPESNQNSVQP